MLKRLLKLVSSLFKSSPPPQKGPQYGDRVGHVTIETAAQLIKHTKFEVGESYRLGEMVITVHANKESMLAAIAATDARRKARHAALTEKAQDIMMMTPDQLRQFKVEAWLKQNEAKIGGFRRIMGRWWSAGRSHYFVKLEAQHPPQAPEQPKEGSNEAQTVKIMSKVP